MRYDGLLFDLNKELGHNSTTHNDACSSILVDSSEARVEDTLSTTGSEVSRAVASPSALPQSLALPQLDMISLHPSEHDQQRLDSSSETTTETHASDSQDMSDWSSPVDTDELASTSNIHDSIYTTLHNNAHKANRFSFESNTSGIWSPSSQLHVQSPLYSHPPPHWFPQGYMLGSNADTPHTPSLLPISNSISDSHPTTAMADTNNITFDISPTTLSLSSSIPTEPVFLEGGSMPHTTQVAPLSSELLPDRELLPHRAMPESDTESSSGSDSTAVISVVTSDTPDISEKPQPTSNSDVDKHPHDIEPKLDTVDLVQTSELSEKQPSSSLPVLVPVSSPAPSPILAPVSSPAPSPVLAPVLVPIVLDGTHTALLPIFPLTPLSYSQQPVHPIQPLLYPMGMSSAAPPHWQNVSSQQSYVPDGSLNRTISQQRPPLQHPDQYEIPHDQPMQIPPESSMQIHHPPTALPRTHSLPIQPSYELANLSKDSDQSVSIAESRPRYAHSTSYTFPSQWQEQQQLQQQIQHHAQPVQQFPQYYQPSPEYLSPQQQPDHNPQIHMQQPDHNSQMHMQPPDHNSQMHMQPPYPLQHQMGNPIFPHQHHNQHYNQNQNHNQPYQPYQPYPPYRAQYYPPMHPYRPQHMGNMQYSRQPPPLHHFSSVSENSANRNMPHPSSCQMNPLVETERGTRHVGSIPVQSEWSMHASNYHQNYHQNHHPNHHLNHHPNHHLNHHQSYQNDQNHLQARLPPQSTTFPTNYSYSVPEQSPPHSHMPVAIVDQSLTGPVSETGLPILAPYIPLAYPIQLDPLSRSLAKELAALPETSLTMSPTADPSFGQSLHRRQSSSSVHNRISVAADPPTSNSVFIQHNDGGNPMNNTPSSDNPSDNPPLIPHHSLQRYHSIDRRVSLDEALLKRPGRHLVSPPPPPVPSEYGTDTDGGEDCTVYSFSTAAAAATASQAPRPRFATLSRPASDTAPDTGDPSPNDDSPLAEKNFEEYRECLKFAPDPSVQFEFAKLLIEAGEPYLDEGFLLLKKASASGMPDAQFFLAQAFYDDGQFEAAYAQWMTAAKRTYPPACYQVARCSEIGKGTKKSMRFSLQMYTKAATMGHRPSMHRLGVAEMKGELGLKADIRNAVRWFKRGAAGADAETPHCLFELSEIYERGSSPHIMADVYYSRSVLIEASNLGFPPAQYKLGYCFEYGLLNCQTDAAESIRLYTLAATTGYSEAQLSLAGWYMTGADDILNKDERRAFGLASLAADQRLPRAQYTVGYFYERGVGIPANLDQALVFYKLAAANGEERAIKRLHELVPKHAVAPVSSSKRRGLKKFFSRK
ncbi:hypothetical protein BASA50_002111 [Batrachochytrium salamandrivorans]|uniref:HCP-like protein n=1 Tax=Batrachochytrium salamandrivorans TaxID=1357716 RepID=A0ABQ8FNR2_9FUNG|nr:hypothetical protein BASA50_002111 [Batrachochytrium salamandrivorans]